MGKIRKEIVLQKSLLKIQHLKDSNNKVKLLNIWKWLPYHLEVY